MRRDHQQDAHPHDRKEWGSFNEHQHPSEAHARSHARGHGKAQRAWNLRRDEADRQIRELRARY